MKSFRNGITLVWAIWVATILASQPARAADSADLLALGLQTFAHEQKEDGSFTAPAIPSSIQYNAHAIFLYEYLGILGKKRAIVDRLLEKIWAAQSPLTGGFSSHEGGPPHLSISIAAYLAARMGGETESSPRMSRLATFINAQGGIAKADTTVAPYLLLFGLDKRANCLPSFTLPLLMSQDEKMPWVKVALYPLAYLLQMGKIHRLPKDRRPEKIMRRQLACPKWTPHPLRVFKFGKKDFFNWLLPEMSDDGMLFDYVPTTVPALMALSTEGTKYADRIARAIQTFEELQIEKDGLLVQSLCSANTGETALVMDALLDMGVGPDHPILRKGEDFLRAVQLDSGAFTFMKHNRQFPDVEDTINAATALKRLDGLRGTRENASRIEKAIRWILTYQYANGSFGAWDKESADGGRFKFLLKRAMDTGLFITQGVVENTARVALGLKLFRDEIPEVAVAERRAISWLIKQQAPDGSFLGAWVVGFQHGTAMVLPTLATHSENPEVALALEKALAYVLATQRADGGWGESPDSYTAGKSVDLGKSSPAQTGMIAGFIMGLLREEGFQHWSIVKGPLDRAVAYLSSTQSSVDGLWHDTTWSSVVFPKVEYVIYPYLQEINPLQALGTYPRILVEAAAKTPSVQLEIRP